jgi:hypothetical protein
MEQSVRQEGNKEKHEKYCPQTLYYDSLCALVVHSCMEVCRIAGTERRQRLMPSTAWITKKAQTTDIAKMGSGLL